MSELPESVLNNVRYRHIHERREHAAANARVAQTAYRRLKLGFVAATAAAAILGGIILLGFRPDTTTAIFDTAAADVTARVEQWANANRFWMGVCQALVLGSAAVFGYVLSEAKHGKNWIRYRAEAEAGRAALFRASLEIGHAQGLDVFRVTGDYFFRGLVEDQIAYLGRRIARSQKRASRFVLVGALVLGFGVIATTLGTLGNAVLLIIAAFISVLSPVLLSAVKSWRETMFDRERVALHEATLAKLSELAADGERFTTALDSGELEVTLAYADKIFAVLGADVASFSEIAGVASEAGAETVNPQ